MIRFGPALKAFFLCAIIGGSAVGYVWQKNEIYLLGRQIRQREIKLAQLQSDNKRLSDQLSILHSPVMLDRRSKQLNLGLVPASPTQVVRLEEPTAPATQHVRNDFSRQFTERTMNRATP